MSSPVLRNGSGRELSGRVIPAGINLSENALGSHRQSTRNKGRSRHDGARVPTYFT